MYGGTTFHSHRHCMRVAGTHMSLHEKNLPEHAANAEAAAPEQREVTSL